LNLATYVLVKKKISPKIISSAVRRKITFTLMPISLLKCSLSGNKENLFHVVKTPVLCWLPPSFLNLDMPFNNQPISQISTFCGPIEEAMFPSYTPSGPQVPLKKRRVSQTDLQLLILIQRR